MKILKKKVLLLFLLTKFKGKIQTFSHLGTLLITFLIKYIFFGYSACYSGCPLAFPRIYAKVIKFKAIYDVVQVRRKLRACGTLAYFFLPEQTQNLLLQKALDNCFTPRFSELPTALVLQSISVVTS